MKKNEILPFAIMCKLKCLMPSDISHSEKDRYHMISLMWNLRNTTDEQKLFLKKFSVFIYDLLVINVYYLLSMSRRGAEREGDTESEAGSRL